MRRRVIGAALTIVGVLTVLFAPAWGVVGCASCVEGYDNPMCGCYEFTTALAVPINWPTEPVGVDFATVNRGVGQAFPPDVDHRRRGRGDRDRPPDQAPTILCQAPLAVTRNGPPPTLGTGRFRAKASSVQKRCTCTTSPAASYLTR
jgi:hypothetical protein